MRRRNRKNGGRRRGARNTFQRVSRAEDSGIIGSGASSTVRKIKLESDCQMLGNKRMIEVSKAVDIPHHTSWSMEDLEKRTKEFLGPTTDLMNRPIVFKNLFDGTAIAEPKELGALMEFAVLADSSPSTTTGFADERMEMTLAFSATVRAKANGA
jgi:hypothetical protein